jgi:hypothetical protein
MSTPEAPPTVGRRFVDPERLVSTFGPVRILTITFAESGPLIRFLPPGDGT